ncbi:ATP-binding protein [uncultured Selenomonas sp.]|uniref:ATP-binding protein n=1 Tax=uncultured Selenomonas sp. TaxID=159275 RepID=UPI0025CDA939|nr:ATP-binding protein [uncultured Selenomonas sp.]
MLRRKILDVFQAWKETPGHRPMIVKGCRQCGKTVAVLAFARKAYAHVVYLNFFENPKLVSIFQGSLQVDTLTMMMTAMLGAEAVFVPGETVIVLDEIQMCPDARTALKFFQLDGRYDVIATGSLLGVEGYGDAPRSIPVGYETTVRMVPMDFEEFLWANGITEDLLALLRTCLRDEQPVPVALHQRMRELLLQYAVVGGMPAVVQAFVDRKNLAEVLAMQRDLVRSYEDDMVKYAQARDKVRIRKSFRSIPIQLAKENKKFQYSLVERRGTSAKLESAIAWLEDAGLALRCYNLSVPELPLSGQAEENVFKLYLMDTGLFISMLDDGTQADVLQGDLLGYKGAIFENLVADFFHKMGRKLYYFRKDSGLEIDFVIRYRGKATLVEVKAQNGNTKSLRTVLAHPEKYHVGQAIKLADTNVGRAGDVLTLPLYLGAFLTEL